MLTIDYYAYNNKLAETHPGEKFLFFVLTIAICLTLASPVTSLAVIILMSSAVVMLAGIPIRLYLKLMLVPAFFLVAGVLTVAFTISREPVNFIWSASFGDYTAGITSAGLAAAGELFLRSLGSVSCLYFLALTTPVMETVGILRKLKVPHLVVELMALVYRFIFILMETAASIYTAQSSRLGYRTLRSGYISLSRLILSLFVKSFRQSQAVYDAMLSRCYDGKLNYVETKRCWSWNNTLLILSADGAVVASWLMAGGLHW